MNMYKLIIAAEAIDKKIKDQKGLIDNIKTEVINLLDALHEDIQPKKIERNCNDCYCMHNGCCYMFCINFSCFKPKVKEQEQPES